MSDLSDKVKQSRASGFSDKQTLDYLAAQPDYEDKVALSRRLGKTDTEILDFLSGTKPLQKKVETSPMALAASFGRGAVGSLLDVGAAPYALAGGDPEKIRESILSGAGAPKATNVYERIAEDVGGAVSSTVGQLGIGKTMAGATGKIGRVGRLLSENPGQQLLAATAAGGAEGATDSPAAGLGAAATTPLVGAVARKIANPNLVHLVGDMPRLIQIAQQHGIPLTAADLTGNKMLHLAEATMERVPGSAGVMQKAQAAQREAFNRAVLEKFGVTGENYATPSVLKRANQALGGELDALARHSDPLLTRQFVVDVDTVANNYGRRLSTDQKAVFQSYIDDLQPMLMQLRANPTGQIRLAATGMDYDEVRKSMALRSRSATDPWLRKSIDGLIDALDNAMELGSPPGLRAQWQDARRRYAALATVEDAMGRGTQADREAGNIPFNSFRQAVSADDRRAFARGEGQYNDLARVADFLAPKVGTSQTTERRHMTNLLTGAGLGSALTYGVTTGDLISPTVGVMAPYGLSKGYLTKPVTDWLTRTSTPQTMREILQQIQQASRPQIVHQATTRESQ